MSEEKKSNFWKALGPGLLLASAAIGTSHLVFATKAGAEYGGIYALVITGALIAVYPFFEYAGRYANATGKSLFHGYRRRHQGWLFLIFALLLINIVGNAALITVSEGLLATVLGIGISISIFGLSVPLWFLLLLVTWGMLMLGRFKFLDLGIKALVALLFVTTVFTLTAVLLKGPIDPVDDFEPSRIMSPAGIALLIALMGYMPTPLYVSIFQSVWSETKFKSSNYRPTLREQLLDFKIGYILTLAMAFSFLVIGIFTLYGSGQDLSDSTAVFAKQVVNVFTTHIGDWAFPIVATAAFAAIYGTFIASFDAFGRCVTGAFFTIKAGEDRDKQNSTLDKALKYYPITLTLVALYVFFIKAVVLKHFGINMGQILRITAIIAFLCSPFIAFLNFRSVLGAEVPESHKPGPFLRAWSWVGLIYISIFAVVFILHRLGMF